MSESSMAGWLIAMSRRRMLATTLIYAASLTIRPVSSAGEEARNVGVQTAPKLLTSSVFMSAMLIDNGLPRPAFCRSRCVPALPSPSTSSCAQ